MPSTLMCAAPIANPAAAQANNTLKFTRVSATPTAAAPAGVIRLILLSHCGASTDVRGLRQYQIPAAMQSRPKTIRAQDVQGAASGRIRSVVGGPERTAR
jgi:hypothetical protein